MLPDSLHCVSDLHCTSFPRLTWSDYCRRDWVRLNGKGLVISYKCGLITPLFCSLSPLNSLVIFSLELGASLHQIFKEPCAWPSTSSWHWQRCGRSEESVQKMAPGWKVSQAVTCDPDSIKLQCFLSVVHRIPADLKGLVYHGGIKYGSEDDWNFVWEKFQITTLASEKSKLMSALAASSDALILNRCLHLPALVTVSQFHGCLFPLQVFGHVPRWRQHSSGWICFHYPLRGQ